MENASVGDGLRRVELRISMRKGHIFQVLHADDVWTTYNHQGIYLIYFAPFHRFNNYF